MFESLTEEGGVGHDDAAHGDAAGHRGRDELGVPADAGHGQRLVGLTEGETKE